MWGCGLHPLTIGGVYDPVKTCPTGVTMTNMVTLGQAVWASVSTGIPKKFGVPGKGVRVYRYPRVY